MAEGEQKLLAEIQRSWQEAGVSGTKKEVQTVVGVLADTGYYSLFLSLIVHVFELFCKPAFPQNVGQSVSCLFWTSFV